MYRTIYNIYTESYSAQKVVKFITLLQKCILHVHVLHYNSHISPATTAEQWLCFFCKNKNLTARNYITHQFQSFLCMHACMHYYYLYVFLPFLPVI